MSETGERKVLIRMPDDMYLEIEQLAKDEYRSMHGQILLLLRRSLDNLKASKGRKKTEEEIRKPDLVTA